MHWREIRYKGYFEEQAGLSIEPLQILVPDNSLETDLLAWAIMPHPQIFEDDPVRQSYYFQYELGRQIGPGLFKLRIAARDASGIGHAVEIAAAMIVAVPTGGQRDFAFKPYWLLDEAVHFKPIVRMSHEQYHGSAYGRLQFDSSETLPHRRLFGATV